MIIDPEAPTINDKNPSLETIDEIEMESILRRVLSMASVADDTYVRTVDIDTSMVPYERKESEANAYVAVQVNTPTDSAGDIHINHTNSNTTINQSSSLQSVDKKHHIQFKWHKFCANAEFCGRILLLLLSLILLSLASAYCVGQWYDSTLKLVTHCEGKEIEDIWRHSYESGVRDSGEVEFSYASQWGHTTESCWTTKKLETNTNALWYTNVYVSESVDQPMNLQSILFGIISIYCLCIIIYNIHTLTSDFAVASANKLHTTSKLYKQFMEEQKKANAAQQKPPTIDSWCTRTVRALVALRDRYWSVDTTGFVIKGIISEMIEILLQTQALLLYNGYNILDPYNEHSTYLANTPHLIVIFAAILSFNCFASGILWLSYATVTKYCHGLLFKLLLFWVDEVADLFYTLFPFIVILSDNDNLDIRVLLSQLNTNATIIGFLSAFVPLFLLCTKSLLIIRNASKQLADKYYTHWKFIRDVAKTPDDDLAVYRAKLAGRSVDAAALRNNKEIFGSKADLLLSINRRYTRTNWIDTDDNRAVSCTKQLGLIFVALLYILYGVGVLWFSLNHLHRAQNYCEMINEPNYFTNGVLNINSTILNNEQQELLQNNPELFFWNKCLYKVYPFVYNNKNTVYNHRCQCRVIVINWEETLSTKAERNLYFNLTQPKILTNMLENWYQLEKFLTNGQEDQAVRTTITQSMFVAKHMKAFEWNVAKIECIEEGISSWKQLEYFKLKDTLVFNLPDDFDGLTSLKYISFEGNALQTIPESICNFTNLEVLDIFIELSIESLPKCISNLHNLQQIIIDNCVMMQNIPLAIFNLPNLLSLSLFHDAISLQSLIAYNAPTNLNTSDTTAALQWLSDAFVINSPLEDYYLSLNPVCDQNVSWYSSELTTWMQEACHYPCNIDLVKNIFCAPRLLGDGKCDIMCDMGDCYSDFGDCVQLCFAPQLTECDMSLYQNDVCDEACDNDYCLEYYNPSLQSKKIRNITDPTDPTNGRVQLRGPDRWHCVVNHSSNIQYLQYEDDINIQIISNDSCQESNSSYVSDEFKTKFDLHSKCEDTWIGDTQCDDLCRTDECNQDGGDCESGTCSSNVCKFIYDAWISFIGASLYNVNSTYFCHVYTYVIYPTLTTILGTSGINEALKDYPCTNPEDYDFNEDGYVNFREFTYLAYTIAGGDLVDQKSKQVNCSDCIGMEYYNVNNNNNIFVTGNATATSINTCYSD